MTRDFVTLTNIATYVSLPNSYANVGRWDEVAKVRTFIRDRGIKKKQGIIDGLRSRIVCIHLLLGICHTLK